MASADKKAERNKRQKAYRAKLASPSKKAERNEQQTAYRAKLASPGEKAEHNEQQKAYRAKVASPEKRTKLNECKKTYRTKTVTKVDIESVISKFHEIVAQGRLYICTCCDQLWYKHTVVNAKKLKKSNPEIKFQ